MKQGVVFHDALHGFRGGRRTGTSTLEAKLAQKLAVLAHKPLFQVFLDIRKAYNEMYRDRCLEVLRRYGVGTNLTRLLKSYWERHRIAPKTVNFIGKDFRTGRCLTQGDPDSPMIFNSVGGAVVRAVLDVVCGPQEAKHGLRWAAGKRNLILYAGDVRKAGRDHKWFQDTLSVTEKMFQKMGLETNIRNSNTMVYTPG